MHKRRFLQFEFSRENLSLLHTLSYSITKKLLTVLTLLRIFRDRVLCDTALFQVLFRDLSDGVPFRLINDRVFFRVISGRVLCYVMLCGIYLPSVVYNFLTIAQKLHWKLIKTDQSSLGASVIRSSKGCSVVRSSSGPLSSRPLYGPPSFFSGMPFCILLSVLGELFHCFRNKERTPHYSRCFYRRFEQVTAVREF